MRVNPLTRDHLMKKTYGRAAEFYPFEVDALLEVVREFVDDIESTGGVTRHEEGYLAPLGDADQAWTDLGGTYVKACQILHRYGHRETPFPMIDDEFRDEEWYDDSFLDGEDEDEDSAHL